MRGACGLAQSQALSVAALTTAMRRAAVRTQASTAPRPLRVPPMCPAFEHIPPNQSPHSASAGYSASYAVRVVSLEEAAQAFGRLLAEDRLVEALGLDAQALVERHPEAAHGRLLVGSDRRLGERRYRTGQLERAVQAGAARHH